MTQTGGRTPTRAPTEVPASGRPGSVPRLEPLVPVEETTRALSAPELTAGDPAEIAMPAENGRPVGLVRAGR